MDKPTIEVDYEPGIGIRYPQQLRELPVPKPIRLECEHMVHKHLNTPISREKPSITALILILLGGVLFVLGLFAKFLPYPHNLILSLIGLLTVFINLVLVYWLSKRSKDMLGDFETQVNLQTYGVIEVEQIREYRARVSAKALQAKLEESDELTGFSFRVNMTMLEKYREENEDSEEETEQLSVEYETSGMSGDYYSEDEDRA